MAQLQDARLESAQLEGAYLAQAQLQGAFLEGAQLEGAYLVRAQLSGADLRNAQGLERSQLLAGSWDPSLPPLLDENRQSWTRSEA